MTRLGVIALPACFELTRDVVDFTEALAPEADEIVLQFSFFEPPGDFTENRSSEVLQGR